MRKRITLSLALLFSCCLNLIGQDIHDKIDPKNFDKAFFQKLLLDRVNHIRDSVGKKPITMHDKLTESAQFHAKFLSKIEKTTHFQKKAKYKDPLARAKAFETGKTFAWENMVSCKILKPTYRSYQAGNAKTTIKTYADLLDFAMKAFMSLKQNVDNIEHERVNQTGIGIVLNTKINHVFIVQVFSD